MSDSSDSSLTAREEGVRRQRMVVRDTVLCITLQFFALTLSVLDVLKVAQRELSQRKKRAIAHFHARHVGPGVFDDYAFLLDAEERKKYSWVTLAAYDKRFQSIFRLSVADFLFVRMRISKLLTHRRDRRGRRRLNPDIVMAAALMYLAHGGTYLTTSLMVRNGISEASVMRCVRLFTRAVNLKLKKSLIRFPTTFAEMERESAAFEARSGIKGIIGAIDGSHIRVAPPRRDQKAFYNRKSFYSVILSAVVGSRGQFLDIATGFPGRMSDSKVLRYQDLYRKADEWFGDFGYFIYGDAAYCLRTWLIVGFRNPRSADELKFNEHGSKARVIVECAFGKLKGQYRCLHYGLKTRNHEMWNEVVTCCCCLRNVSIFVSGAGWGYDQGVVRGSKDPSDPNTFGQDPDEMYVGDFYDRVPDDPAAFAKRAELLAVLQQNNFQI